jgi:hypothetical protein
MESKRRGGFFGQYYLSLHGYQGTMKYTLFRESVHYDESKGQKQANWFLNQEWKEPPSGSSLSSAQNIKLRDYDPHR